MNMVQNGDMPPVEEAGSAMKSIAMSTSSQTEDSPTALSALLSRTIELLSRTETDLPQVVSSKLTSSVKEESQAGGAVPVSPGSGGASSASGHVETGAQDECATTVIIGTGSALVQGASGNTTSLNASAAFPEGLLSAISTSEITEAVAVPLEASPGETLPGRGSETEKTAVSSNASISTGAPIALLSQKTTVLFERTAVPYVARSAALTASAPATSQAVGSPFRSVRPHFGQVTHSMVTKERSGEVEGTPLKATPANEAPLFQGVGATLEMTEPIKEDHTLNEAAGVVAKLVKVNTLVVAFSTILHFPAYIYIYATTDRYVAFSTMHHKSVLPRLWTGTAEQIWTRFSCGVRRDVDTCVLHCTATQLTFIPNPNPNPNPNP